MYSTADVPVISKDAQAHDVPNSSPTIIATPIDNELSKSEGQEQPLFVRCNAHEMDDCTRYGPIKHRWSVESIESEGRHNPPLGALRSSLIVEDYDSDSGDMIHISRDRDDTSAVGQICEDVIGNINLRPDETSGNIMSGTPNHSAGRNNSNVIETSRKGHNGEAIQTPVRDDSSGLAPPKTTSPRISLARRKSGLLTDIRGILTRTMSKRGSLRSTSDTNHAQGSLGAPDDRVEIRPTPTVANASTNVTECDLDIELLMRWKKHNQETQTSSSVEITTVDRATEIDPELCGLDDVPQVPDPEVSPPLQRVLKRKLNDIQMVRLLLFLH